MALWFVYWILDQEVWVQAWPRSLCRVLGQDSFIVPLSTREYEWVPANCWRQTEKVAGLSVVITYTGLIL